MTTVKPCPKCDVTDWEYELYGTACRGCGYVAARIPMERQKAERAKAEGSLRERLAYEEAIVVDSTLFERQLAAEREHLAKLVVALEERAAASKLDPAHPLFAETWLYRARLDYTAETVRWLETGKEPMACPQCHAIRGVEGEHQTRLLRLCPKCNRDGIEREGERLARLAAKMTAEASPEARSAAKRAGAGSIY